MWSRRNLLQFGTVQIGGLSLGAMQPAGAASLPGRGRARACILLFMDGGPSHIDLFDMKPEAPEEIRGPFRSIRSSVPGIRVCEHLPRLARQMHHVTQVRSVCHEETIHDPAVYQTLTGYRHVNSRGDLKVEPTDHPQFGVAFGSVDPTPAVMPKVVELPETMKMGARVLPGQNAGFLGLSHDPFRVEVTAKAEVMRPGLAHLPGFTPQRLSRRAALLDTLNGRLSELRAQGEMEELDAFQQQALAMLAEPRVNAAFDLEREPAPLRDGYGRHRHGQSVLLARRLVEAGARFVTVYWGKEDQDWADGKGPRPANNPWDTHRNHFPLVKDDLLPRADQALSALLEDLHGRGMLAETLVLWMGEFGRTPKISEFGSRDHWPHANTMLLAGAGLPGGAVYGRTDATASEVVEDPVSPADVTATVFHLLGVDPRTPMRDTSGAVYPLSQGSPIRALL